MKFKHLHEDPIELGKRANIPVRHEEVKIVGPSRENSIRSLALKLWMIEDAQHTIDVVYYIFKYDIVGQAKLGVLCNAVQRGVDVRPITDYGRWKPAQRMPVMSAMLMERKPNSVPVFRW